MAGLLGGMSKAVTKLVTASSNSSQLERINRALSRLSLDVEAKLRILKAESTPLPDIQSFSGGKIEASIMGGDNAPWANIELPERTTPGMVSPEECQYYMYIGQYYRGHGELVELGPWLGRSTYFILEGLKSNPNASDKKLYVFDDFIWRAHWMDSDDYQQAHHSDFQPLFEEHSKDLLDKIEVQKRKFVTYDGNANVEALKWHGAPIEILYVDCGRTMEANEAWWKTLSPYLIPGKSLLVLEDWNTHRQVPKQWFNQIDQWVASKGDSLQMLHELERGGIATFLYHGTPES